VVLRTFETYADTPEEGEKIILDWQQSDAEKEDGGVRAKRYKLGWYEHKQTDEEILAGRDVVLANFLDLMGKLPNTPKLEREKSLIHKPFDPFPEVKLLEEPSKTQSKIIDVTKDVQL
jgi:hypothetical protein